MLGNSQLADMNRLACELSSAVVLLLRIYLYKMAPNQYMYLGTYVLRKDTAVFALNIG